VDDAGPFFHEFVAVPPVAPEVVDRRLREAGFLGGVDLGAYDPDWAGRMLFCATERRTPAEIDALVACLEKVR